MPSHAGPAGSPGPLHSAAQEVLRRPEVLAAALVDVESGLTLDVVVPARGLAGTSEVEAVAAAQVEVLRSTVDLARVLRMPTTEVVVWQGESVVHVVRPLPDPVGAGLALALVVAAPERNLRRVRRLLDRIDPRALVPAGPPVRRAPTGPATPSVQVPPAVPAPRAAADADGSPTAPLRVVDPSPRSVPEPAERPTHAAGPGEAQVQNGGLAEEGAGASDWFDPVVPGEPPPLRRTLGTRSETDHLVLRRRPTESAERVGSAGPDPR